LPPRVKIHRAREAHRVVRFPAPRKSARRAARFRWASDCQAGHSVLLPILAMPDHAMASSPTVMARSGSPCRSFWTRKEIMVCRNRPRIGAGRFLAGDSRTNGAAGNGSATGTLTKLALGPASPCRAGLKIVDIGPLHRCVAMQPDSIRPGRPRPQARTPQFSFSKRRHDAFPIEILHSRAAKPAPEKATILLTPIIAENPPLFPAFRCLFDAAGPSAVGFFCRKFLRVPVDFCADCRQWFGSVLRRLPPAVFRLPQI